MLHFKLVDAPPYGEFRSVIDLADKTSIELRFNDVLCADEDAFTDELSERILRELDGSYRTEEYALVTRFGKSCITCLAASFKLAMLICHYRNAPCAILSCPARADDDTWEWLAKNIDATIYLLRAEMPDQPLTIHKLLQKQLADLTDNGQPVEDYLRWLADAGQF